MRLVIHVGLHRAASTSLQAWLRARGGGWQAQGCLVQAGFSTGRGHGPFAVLAGQHFRQLGPQAAVGFLLAELDKLAPGIASAVISDENLLGPMPGGGAPPFAAAADLATAFALLRQHHDLRPVLILRHHADWIGSLHKTQQLRGDGRSLRDFAAGLPAGAVRFRPLVELLQPALVTSREAIAADGGRGLQAAITAAAGLAAEPAQAFTTVNPALDERLRRLTVALGRRSYVLAELGGVTLPRLLERIAAGTADRDELVAVLAARAVRVGPALPPARRLAGALVHFRRGIPPDRRLPLAACRDVVAQWLESLAAPVSDIPLDSAQFAEDREWLAARHLPEWSTPRP
jgi:hypothetical protein